MCAFADDGDDRGFYQDQHAGYVSTIQGAVQSDPRFSSGVSINISFQRQQQQKNVSAVTITICW